MSPVPGSSGAAMAYTVRSDMTLAEFMRLYLVDDDLGLRFVRDVNGTKQLTTIRPEPPDFESSLSITLEVLR